MLRKRWVAGDLPGGGERLWKGGLAVCCMSNQASKLLVEPDQHRVATTAMKHNLVKACKGPLTKQLAAAR
jgi:hypothetical protein